MQSREKTTDEVLLKEIINGFSAMPDVEYKKIANWLTELVERRKSDLRPDDKFLGATITRQLLRVNSEIGEIQEALHKVKYPTMDLNLEEATEHIAEEIADAQMSLETLFAICGFNEKQRREARRKVIEKNRVRGYYEVPSEI